MQLLAAIGCVHMRSTSQCSLCLATDRNHHHDDGKRLVSTALRLWHLLSHHDNHHWNIDHTQSVSRPVPLSLEHGELDVATDCQFLWAVWLHRSTNGIGNE